MHGCNAVNGLPFRWVGQKLELLAKFNSEGHSSAQIAKLINEQLGTAFSRNAVIGARSRAGMVVPARDTLTPEQRLARRKQSRGVGRGNYQRVKVARLDEFRNAPTVEDMAIPAEQRATIMDLTFGNCHWPVGHPSDAGFFFCGGAAAKGRPYCASHCNVAYMKPTKPSPNFRLQNLSARV
jgi:GcrA cell cycle regulator